MRAAKAAITVFILTLLLGIIVTSQKVSSPPIRPLVSVDPPNVIDIPKTISTFTVNINISFVSGLHSWELKMRYNPLLLSTNSSQIMEGPFLARGGATFWNTPYFEADYVKIGCLIIGQGSATGSGILANITFTVQRRGETNLDLYNIKLANVNGVPISYNSQSGYFRNIESSLVPSAEFVYYAQTYNVTFNASLSSSPDGIIQSYTWFWGGKPLDSIKRSDTADPVIWHQYPETDPPERENATVRLIVIDDKNVTGSILLRVITFGIPVHDLAITSVQAVPESVLIGNFSSTTINVNITNNGNQLEETTVTISYNSTYFDFQNISATQWTVLQSQPVVNLAAFENRTAAFTWNTTTFPPGVYAIKGEASSISGENDTSNNVLTGSMRIVTVLYAPVALFSYSPENPVADQEIFFNGSQSHDPDGTIVSYSWDFGDFSQESLSEPATSHVYTVGGNFSVTLTVTDNDGFARSTTLPVSVSRLASTVSLLIPPITVKVGSNVLVEGNVSSASPASVTISYRLYGQQVWDFLANATSDANGLFSYSWSPAAAGTFELKAEWKGDGKYYGATSEIVVITAKFGSDISLLSNRLSADVDETLVLNGSVAPAHYGAVVAVEYRLNGGSWMLLAKTATDENGMYNLEWRPILSGVYELRAKWDGDNESFGAESLVITVNVSENVPENSFSPNYFLYAGGAVVLVSVLILFFWAVKRRGRR